MLDEEKFNLWRKPREEGGLLIQDAFPELSVDQREQLISGYCGECWDTLWSDE